MWGVLPEAVFKTDDSRWSYFFTEKQKEPDWLFFFINSHCLLWLGVEKQNDSISHPTFQILVLNPWQRFHHKKTVICFGWGTVRSILSVQMDHLRSSPASIFANIINQIDAHYSLLLLPSTLRWSWAPPPLSASWSLVLDFPGQSSWAECFPLPSPPHTVAVSL